jgi:ABC-type transport system involved in cytochrome bd biosynthesis fused ATPase/permease subunit
MIFGSQVAILDEPTAGMDVEAEGGEGANAVLQGAEGDTTESL